MTIAELIKIVKKPGKLYLPVLMGEDVTYIVAEKSDFLTYLDILSPDASAPLKARYIDVEFIEGKRGPEIWLT